MKDKIICFLDIDGVLNSQVDEENVPETADKSDMLFERPIKQLNELVDYCDFVISSTWRMGNTAAELQKMLDNRGFKGKVVGITPVFWEDWLVRGNEIKCYCEKNEVDKFIIIDDDGDMLLEHKDCFFQTDAYCGLTYTVVGKIKKYLNGIKL